MSADIHIPDDDAFWAAYLADHPEARRRTRAATPKAPARPRSRASRAEARTARPETTYVPCGVVHEITHVRCVHCGTQYAIPTAPARVLLRADSGPGSASGLTRMAEITSLPAERLRHLPREFRRTWTTVAFCHADGCIPAAPAASAGMI